MHSVFRNLRRPSRHDHPHFRHYQHDASVVSSINWVRDRALDHAVEKERDLQPMINLKNLINSEPSKSLPLSIVSDKRSSLGILTRPIDFIRKYPSVFQEFLPGGIGIHPHLKLTPQTLTLDAEEQLLFQSEMHQKDAANRLLKLLMISRANKIPLSVIDRLKWDLGLPNDYTQTLVPLFPDYFQVTSNGNELELVCWSNELAVSVMQTNSMTSFPLQYSRGFELDNKFKKWVDDWQKLPYISPYENASAKSEESGKWIVGVLHEVLHLLVPKKTEKDNLLVLGEHLGVRSRFKRALLEHPGIFYVSSKLHTHTVVLREAYKRDLLVSKPPHPLMNLRSSYIHLMNMVKEKSKSKGAEVGATREKATRKVSDGEDDELSDMEDDDSETEGVTDSDSNSHDAERVTMVVDPIRTPPKKTDFKGKIRSVRRGRRNDNGESGDLLGNRSSKIGRRSTQNSRVSDTYGRRGRGNDSNSNYAFDEKSDSRRDSKKYGFDDKFDSKTNLTSDRRARRETITKPPSFLRTEAPGAGGRSSERSSVPRTRERRF